MHFLIRSGYTWIDTGFQDSFLTSMHKTIDSMYRALRANTNVCNQHTFWGLIFAHHRVPSLEFQYRLMCGHLSGALRSVLCWWKSQGPSFYQLCLTQLSLSLDQNHFPSILFPGLVLFHYSIWSPFYCANLRFCIESNCRTTWVIISISFFHSTKLVDQKNCNWTGLAQRDGFTSGPVLAFGAE